MTDNILREALERVLERDAEIAKYRGLSKCTCIALSRSGEIEYENGRCPHQLARQAIAMETGGATESIYGKEIPAHYPDFIYDTDGLDRWREISRTGDGHDCCNANKNTVLRLVLTIDRLKAQCAAISSLKEKGA